MIVFLNKGKNGINKFVPFRRKMSSIKYPNNGMETSSCSVPFHPAPFYSAPLHSIRFKISKHSLRILVNLMFFYKLLNSI
ncbi:hypothetical protein MtrunA17_Chr2g0323621 [Medicago truncatula]|uniref:Uncharacterized protein n=1 Tax=Medicago truncatula TaxID=3880 RepID=A0A396JKQ0_MEDTR|nr:hypothetical protein MtrunA17_Chr2g0323621 [Medicago truncatula]